jgi:oligopeptide/dipeptide ABC transporter ATP-binding protein
MIFQEPMTSLNPVLTIGRQIGETLMLHQRLDRAAALRRAVEMLRLVHIPEAERRVTEYPHQLSGGMRQRVVGAMAIAAPPRLLIADEPTTSLDLTIQAQYLRLLKDLQARHRLAMIFVTHNLGIVAKICDRVAVMYAGRIVEAGPVAAIFSAPAHPYTRALLESVPRLGETSDWLTPIEGQPPDLVALPPGCAFAPRCPQAMDRCRAEAPPEFAAGAAHTSRCWLEAPP